VGGRYLIVGNVGARSLRGESAGRRRSWRHAESLGSGRVGTRQRRAHAPDRGGPFLPISRRRHSPTGHTKTTPAPGIRTTDLTVSVASCAEYEHGYFTANRRLGEEQPDLVLFLGDYVYEDTPGGHVAALGNVRSFVGCDARRSRTTGSGTPSTRPTPISRRHTPQPLGS
jgi:hypothetical protein